MSGLSRFSNEEILRRKRLNFKEGKVTVVSHKLLTARDQATAYRVYERKLGPAVLSLIDPRKERQIS